MNKELDEAWITIYHYNDEIIHDMGSEYIENPLKEELDIIEKALQRLNKYEQILSGGRLTDRNYKNTTLDLDSCKPYLRLGQLEDIYEESKQND